MRGLGLGHELNLSCPNESTGETSMRDSLGAQQLSLAEQKAGGV
jgi:hypothetical protein